jgi:hypothetical protein
VNFLEQRRHLCVTVCADCLAREREIAPCRLGAREHCWDSAGLSAFFAQVAEVLDAADASNLKWLL